MEEPAAVQCPTRPMTAGLTSFPKAPARSREFQIRVPGPGHYWGLSEQCPSSSHPLWLPRKEENGGDKTAKDCPGLDPTAVCSCVRLSVSGLVEGWTLGRLRHAGLTCLQEDPGSTAAGTFKCRLNPTDVYIWLTLAEQWVGTRPGFIAGVQGVIRAWL